MANEPVPRNYTFDFIDKALTALALGSGATKKALEIASADGFEVTREQLNNFRRTYPDRYTRIMQEVTARHEEDMAEGTVRMAMAYENTEQKLLDKLDTQIEELSPKDTAGALRNVAVSKAVNIDKHQQLTGRTSMPEDTRNANEILESLAAQFKGVVTVREIEIRSDEQADRPEDLQHSTQGLNQ
jgi:thermostable 8-oxoguanine DNA glycosylase